jgi:hypothetical protein
LAKVKNPDLAKIDRLGPDIDFYYWKGIPVVRKMPKKYKPIGTEAQKATWAAMKYAHDQYQELPTLEREAYKFLVRDSQMCNRDFVTKLCLKNYQEIGEKYSSWRVSFEPQGGGITKVVVFKAFSSTDIISCMTYNETRELLEWLEISPSLRGKKFRRRWDLKENIENSHNSFNKTAVGIEIELLENKTDLSQPTNSFISGDYLFMTQYTDGLSVWKIEGNQLNFITSTYPGSSLTNVIERDGFVFVVSHLGGMYGYYFDGFSLDSRGSVSLGKNFNDIVVDDDYIYTAEQNDGVAVYTHDGYSFTEVARISTGGLCLSVSVYGSYVIASNLHGELFLYSFDGSILTLLDSTSGGTDILRHRSSGEYICLATWNPSLEVYKILSDKLEKVYSTGFGYLVNNIRFFNDLVFLSCNNMGPTVFKFHSEQLFKVFEKNTGLYGRGLGVSDKYYYAATLADGVFLYEYSNPAPFFYNFLVDKANGDDYLCIKSDPEDLSSFGLSGLYEIPY